MATPEVYLEYPSDMQQEFAVKIGLTGWREKPVEEIRRVLVADLIPSPSAVTVKDIRRFVSGNIPDESTYVSQSENPEPISDMTKESLVHVHKYVEARSEMDATV